MSGTPRAAPDPGPGGPGPGHSPRPDTGPGAAPGPRLRLVPPRTRVDDLEGPEGPPEDERRGGPRDGAPASWKDPRWGHRSPAGRIVSAVVGAGALAAAVRLGGSRSRLLWTCAVAPDTALLVGIAAAPSFERLPPYAVRPYNVLHSPAVPAALLAAAAVTRRRGLAVAGLAWLGHIGVDRGFGYGRRDRDGYVS